MIGPQLPEGWGQQARDEAREEAEPFARAQVALYPVTSLPWLAKFDVGAGLRNLGNTCFLNSVLQCLAYVPPLYQAIREQVLHGFTCPCPIRANNKLCMACYTEQQLLQQITSSSNRAISPTDVCRRLHFFSKAFTKGRQEDAHELLITALDAIERDSRRALVQLGHPKTTRTLIEHLFCGRVQQQVRCLECDHCSNTYQTVTALSLDLQRGVHSVEQSLAQYTASELLDGANKYKCDKCNKLVAARKSVCVYDEPNVLVIHLKRFDAFALSAKISRHIEFKATLTLPAPTPSHAASTNTSTANGHANGTHAAPKVYGPAPPPNRQGPGPSQQPNGHSNGVANGHSNGAANGHSNGHGDGQSNGGGLGGGSGARSGAQYVLCGVVVHSGVSVHSGHYVAYVRNSMGKWFCANDDAVYAVGLGEVLQQQAYMLFYSRCGQMKTLPPPPDQPPAAAPTSPTLKRAASGPPPGPPPAASKPRPAPSAVSQTAVAPRAAADAAAQGVQPSSGGSWSTAQSTTHSEAEPGSAKSTTLPGPLSRGSTPRVILLPKGAGPPRRPAAQHAPARSALTPAQPAAPAAPRPAHPPQPAQAVAADPPSTQRSAVAHTQQTPECAYAATIENRAVREAVQGAYQQLLSALRSSPECVQELQTLCTSALQAGTPLAELIKSNPAARRGIVGRHWQGLRSPQSQPLAEMLRKQLTEAEEKVHAGHITKQSK